MAYYIAEGAVVKGQVTMADGASVWYNATVRGDSEDVYKRQLQGQVNL